MPTRNMAWIQPIAITNHRHKQQHEVGRAHEGAMCEGMGWLEEHMGGTTEGPPVTVVQGLVHEDVTRGGSRNKVERLARTTTKALDAVAHGGAHGGSVPIEPGGHKEPNGVTTLEGGEVVVAATTRGGEEPDRLTRV